ncbi:hypothetical protein IC762_12665 [Bradyrhizobium genosp. L]|nr:hypothetical protein IC762_12665 [Bradyrhizobium genosp. L]
MAMALSILAAMFAAGYFAGYATRAWRSQRRRAHYLASWPYQATPSGGVAAKSPTSMFGHPRRAF